MSDKLRALMGAIRAFPTVGRSIHALEAQASQSHARLEALEQRALAQSHQIEHLYSLLEGADPQETREIVVGVRDAMRSLSVELTEQANQTSTALKQLD